MYLQCNKTEDGELYALFTHARGRHGSLDAYPINVAFYYSELLIFYRLRGRYADRLVQKMQSDGEIEGEGRRRDVRITETVSKMGPYSPHARPRVIFHGHSTDKITH